MPRKRRFSRHRPARGLSHFTALRTPLGRRPNLEVLEDRRLLAVDFAQIANRVAGPTGAMANITTGLRALDSLSRLPLINKPIEELTQVTNSLEDFRSQLFNTLNSLNPASAATAVQTAIYNVLSPLHVLADKVGPATIGPEDVVVTVGASDVAVSLNIGKSVTFSSAAGLGIDSVPFKPDAREQGSDGSFTVGLTYSNFNFGFKNNAPYFSTDALNELQFKIYGYLPEEMTVGLGFLVLKAIDKTPEKTPDKADLSLTFSADITPSFSLANPQIGGGANLLLGLESSFPAPGLPEFRTDFVFKWNLSNSSAPLSSGWGAPELAFNNVEMNIGSLLGNLVQPLAERAQDLLLPLQPIFDLITEPIPVIDDLSAAMDGPVIDLVFLSNTLSAYPNLPQEFFNIIKAADKLQHFSQIVDALAGRGEGHWVPLGSFNISGPPGTSLLNAPAAALGNLGLSKWSSLVFSGGQLNLQGFKDAIVDALPDGVGDEVNSLWDALTGEAAGNGLTLDFPVTRDPSGVAMAFLLGQQDSDLVTMTANFKVAIDKLINLAPIPGLIVGLRASGAFTAYAKMGYDIKGLQEAIAPLYAGQNFDASKIMHGLWIDRNTRLQGDASILVTGGVGLPDVVELTADGGLTTNLTITLSTNTSAQKIRPLAGELGSSLFALSGTMDAVAQVTFKAGFEVLGEWIGFDKSWPFAKYNIYKFDTSNVPVPPSMQPVPSTPPELARYDAATRTLTLAAGVNAPWRGALGAEKDENFTLRRMPNGGLAVSAFGYVQKFAGPFDLVDAGLGDGNDRLHVIDPSSTTFYLIDAGDDDDIVNVDGKVKVYIQGGKGNDTLDGGSGRESIDVRGGPGQNNITIGDGLLKDVDPNVSILIDGGFFGRLKIDNTDDNVGSDYYFYDDPNSLFWQLTVTSRAPGGVSHVLNFPRMVVNLRAGAGDDHFYGWFPQFANIYAGAGDDTWDITWSPNGLQRNILPHLEYYMTYYGGPGRDVLPINDSNAEFGSGIGLRTNKFDGPSSIVSWGNVARPTQILVSGVEETTITSPKDNVVVNAWADGPVTIQASSVQFNTDSYVPGETQVHLVNTPAIFFVDIQPAATQRGMGIDEFGPYLGNPLDYTNWPNGALTPVVAKLRIDYDEATTAVDFFGSLMTIEPSVMYSTRPWKFRFVGSEDVGAFNILKIAPPDPTNPNVASRDFSYHIAKDTLTIGPMTIEARNLNAYQLIGGQGSDTITIDALAPGVTANINGGLGDDHISVGGGNLGFAPAWSLDGGGGNDTLTLNNTLSTFNNNWEIQTGKIVFFGGVFSMGTDNIENLELLNGAGNDIVNFTGNISQAIRLDTGEGNDTINVGYNGVPTSIQAPLSIDGAGGNDGINWYPVSNGFDDGVTIATYPVKLEGGLGRNTLFIDDKTRGSRSLASYDFYADRVYIHTLGFGAWTDFDYDNMTRVVVDLGENDNAVSVYGVSSDISDDSSFTIIGHGGNDSFAIYPHDSSGNLTINGNLGIGGRDRFDQIIIDNSASTQPTTYTFVYELGTSIVRGIGPADLVVGDVELLDVRGGSGADTFRLEGYLSPITELKISAGEGDDVLEISPSSKDTGATLNDALPYSFDGGGGADSFSLFNNNSSMPWYYSRTGNALSVLSPGEFRLETTPLSFESLTLTGGTQRDTFYLADQASGETTSIDGAAGLDTLLLGFNGYTRNIHGPVVFDGGVDGGMLAVLDPTNTTGVTVHIEGGAEGTIGSAPGDTLFGAGGSVLYRNLADDEFGEGFGLTLRLGNGADTIYAVPQPTATTSIDAGEPSEGSGDLLYLGLNQAQNAAIQNFGNGNGRATSANLKPVEWFSVEQLDTEYVAPNRFLVTNTLDSGPGSLRQAILNANDATNVGGADLIRFSIPGVGTHTIRPLSPLPGITDPVVLDATTQPGFAGTPVIELDGSQAGSSNGLNIVSGGSTVRGLAINRFLGTPSGGIFISGPGGNVIQGNHIGTNLAGNAAFPLASQSNYGVVLFGSDGNVIGTNGDNVNDSAEGNVVSGHNTAGILLVIGQPGQLPDNNVIAGNFIGTSADGNTLLGNGRMGVFFIGGGTGNRIGTNSDDLSDSFERNVISGNTEAGIFLDGDGNVIAGNFIGINADGNAPLGNGDGIRVSGADNNRIGGTAVGAGNVIAFNTARGILIDGVGVGNAVLGNSIYGNGRIGIDLNAVNDTGNGVTPNDVSDTDSGPNNLQNFPVITNALAVGESSIVSGTLQSTPSANFRLEFFLSSTSDPSGYGEGQIYLGFASATADSSGRASFITEFSTVIPSVGQFISATATDPLGNTSEFSASVPLVANGSQNVIALPHPTAGGHFLVSSPVGSSLTATVTPNAGVTPPSGIEFPFGFVDFTVSGLAPGSAANVTIAGLDTSQIGDYYKYGATPANPSNHWYNFLFGQATDNDSATGTGMEIVGGTIVLHLIDGKRGDDDLAANGAIADIGGPVLNHAPVAVNDTATMNEDASLSLSTSTLKSNDKDADGDTLTVMAVSGATNGTVTLNSGTVKFIPTSNFNGAAGFDYTLSDGYLTTTGHVTVTVREANDAPTANPDTATVAEDGTVDIEVRANDSTGPANEGAQTLTVKTASAKHGAVTINANGTLRYRPDANYYGADTISYTIVDNGTTNGKAKPLTSKSTVAVTVTAVNDAPVGKDLTATVTEDGTVELKLSATDIETSTSDLLFTATSLPTQGLLSTRNGTPVQVGDRFKGPETLVYEPGAAREGTGSDGFKYTVTDAGGSAGAVSDEATVTLNITKAVDDGKVAVDSSGIVRIGGTSGNDNIVASRSGNKLQVKINGKVVSSNTSLGSVREIRVWGRGGNDNISIQSIDAPTLLHGGVGNDEITGGLGSNLIFGGAGNDKLKGGSSKDLLVGGDGADTLVDALGDDVLVGGNVSNQFTDDFLRQILQQWASRRSQDSRFQQELTDDGAVDSLFDSQGDDWFILGQGDVLNDPNHSDHDLVTFV